MIRLGAGSWHNRRLSVRKPTLVESKIELSEIDNGREDLREQSRGQNLNNVMSYFDASMESTDDVSGADGVTLIYNYELPRRSLEDMKGLDVRFVIAMSWGESRS